MTGPIKFKELPSTEALERAAEQMQERRKETAAALLDAAHKLQTAQQEMETRKAAYASAWKEATSGAWDSSELTRQGFPKPIASRTSNRRRKQTSTTHTTADTTSDSDS